MIALVPMPRKLTETKAGYLIAPETTVSLQANCAPDDARLLLDCLRMTVGYAPALCAANGDVRLTVEKGESEGYTLTVSPDGVRIIGGDDRGLFYGIQTLCQLIRLYGASLPGAQIEDAPRFATRGYYFDVSRGRVPTLAELKLIADRCARYKINQLQFNMQHTFPYKGFEEAWFYADPITPEEIRAFDAYCKTLRIELVPSLACFGHMYHILGGYTHQAECELEWTPGAPFRWFDRMSHHTVNVSSEESFRMVCELIDQYIPLFSSNLVNITCDETNDLGRGKSQEYVAKNGGREAVYVQFVNRVAKYIRETYHRDVAFWSDILVREPKYLRTVDQKLVCLHWEYGAQPSRENAKTIGSCGLKWVACPGTSAWNRFIPYMEGASSNIRHMAAYAKEFGADGLLNTDWGDFGHINLTALSMPGMMMGAAMSWNPDDARDDAALDEAFGLCEYGCDKLPPLMREASRMTNVDWRAVCVLHDGENGAGEHKQEYVERITADKAKASCKALLEKRGELLMLSHTVRADRLSDIPALECGLEGAAICEALVPFLQNTAYGMKTTEFMGRYELAAWIERWFCRYSAAWRALSKESELWRVADALRQICLLLRK